MIAETRAKVKTILKQLIESEAHGLHKPDGKLLLEGTMGVLLSGSTNLTQMAQSLKEPIPVKHTHKRLQRMIGKPEHLATVNRITLHAAGKRVDRDTILALDGGDLTHQYGDSFEDICRVKDGSTGRIENGYWLNQITGYNRATRITFPVAVDMYSPVRDGFRSAPARAVRLVQQVVSEIGTDGLWVMDRGYDSRQLFSEWDRMGITFITRMQGTRDVIVRGNRQNIKDAAWGINRRYNLDRNGRFGYRVVQLPLHQNGKDHLRPFTLIAFQGQHSRGLMWFLTSGEIRSSREIQGRLRGYFKRWSIEDAYRFEKQGFGIERTLVRSFHAIRSMLALSVLAWLVLVEIQQEERLRETVLQTARPVHRHSRYRPRFLYYQLLRGVQLLFEGARQIFRFRLTRAQRLQRQFLGQQRPLWHDWLPEPEIMG